VGDHAGILGAVVLLRLFATLEHGFSVPKSLFLTGDRWRSLYFHFGKGYFGSMSVRRLYEEWKHGKQGKQRSQEGPWGALFFLLRPCPLAS
jgi:hypothetical protein